MRMNRQPEATMEPQQRERQRSRWGGTWWGRGVVIALVIYWLVLITATHLPKLPDLPPSIRLSDKLLHMAAYAVLALLAATAWSLRWQFGWRAAAVLIVALAVHGALDEWTQPWFNRHADVADWLADVTGGAIGLAVFAMGRMLARRQGWAQRR